MYYESGTSPRCGDTRRPTPEDTTPRRRGRGQTFRYNTIEEYEQGVFLPRPSVKANSCSRRTADVSVGVAGIQGWRKNMEDRHALLQEGPCFTAIFDGHRGDAVSAALSTLLLRELNQTALEDLNDETLAAVVQEKFVSIDAALLKEHEVAGSTATVALPLSDGRFVCASVGDTRCVLRHAGKVVALSVDHSPSLESEQNRIAEAGGVVVDARLCLPGVQGRLGVSRAFGDLPFKQHEAKPLAEQAVSPVPDVTVLHLSASDEFAVLGCDGVFEVLSNQQVVAFVRKKLDEGLPPEEVAVQLCRECLALICPGKGCDNITAAVIVFTGQRGKSSQTVFYSTSSEVDRCWGEMKLGGRSSKQLTELPGSCSTTLNSTILNSPSNSDHHLRVNTGMKLRLSQISDSPSSSVATPSTVSGRNRIRTVTQTTGQAWDLQTHQSVPSDMEFSQRLSTKWDFTNRASTVKDMYSTMSPGTQTTTSEPVVVNPLAPRIFELHPKNTSFLEKPDAPSPHVCSSFSQFVFGRAAPEADSPKNLAAPVFVLSSLFSALLAVFYGAMGNLPVALVQVVFFLGMAVCVALVRWAGHVHSLLLEIPVYLGSVLYCILYDITTGGETEAWILPVVLVLFAQFAGVHRRCTWVLMSIGMLWITIRSLEQAFSVFGIFATICDSGWEPRCTSSVEFFVGSYLTRMTVFVSLPALTHAHLATPDPTAAILDQISDSALAFDLGSFSSSLDTYDPSTRKAANRLLSVLRLYRTCIPEALTQRVGVHVDCIESVSSKSSSEDLSDSTSNSSSSSGSTLSDPPSPVALPGHITLMKDFAKHPKQATIMRAELCVECIPTGDLGRWVSHFICSAITAAKETDGTILLVAGNHLLATWNFQGTNHTHIQQGGLCGLEIQRRMKTLHTKRFVPWSAAVVYGKVLVGIAGTAEHRAPVVIGEAVSQAAMLTRLSFQLGVNLILSDHVHDKLRSVYATRPIDVIRTDPESDGQVVYELMGRKSGKVGPRSNVMLFVQAFSDLRKMKLEEARGKLCQYLKLSPRDQQAARLMQLVLYLGQRGEDKAYCREFIGWEDLEARTKDVPVDDELADVLSELSTPKRERWGTSFEPVGDVDGLQETKDEVAALKNAIRDYEFTSKVHDYAAWGLCTHTGSDVSEPKDKKLPLTFEDHKGRTWQRAERCLGTGAFGEVWMGMGSDGGLVAVKCMRLPESKPAGAISPRKRRRQENACNLQQIEEVLKEVALMSQLRHENIASYLSSAVVNGYVMIVMEYLSGGSLANVLEQFRTLSVSSIQRYLRDIVHGLEFLHKKEIIHRDMKPHNVLLLIDGRCKLADFGASAKLSQLAHTSQGVIGTPLYMAPEACMGHACKASDIWGVGIMACQMFSGRVPYVFSEANPFNPHGFIFKLGNSPDFGPTIPDEVPPEARQLVAGCLQKRPEDRLEASDLKFDAFLLC